MRTGIELPEIEEAFASGAVSADPHPTYRILRERAPVYWSEYLGHWVVTPFDLVESTVMQPNRFSSYGFEERFLAQIKDAPTRYPTIVHHFQQRGLIKADPPEHTRLRRTVRGPFSVHSVARLYDVIRSRVDAILDSSGPRLDVMGEFARPLTVSVISDLLGVPEEDRGQFPQWSYDLIRFFGTPQPTTDYARALEDALVQWRALLTRLFLERQARPQEDLLSFVAAQIEAGTLSQEEALFTCVHLMIGGHETTTSTIGTTLFSLITHPQAYAEVQASPGLLENAIEEAIRQESPVMRARRTATEDAEIGGQAIAAGDGILPIYAAANRDPARFVDPEAYDVHRDFFGLHHHAFGRGTHFCLGAPLARLEATIALGTLLQRYPDLALPADFEPHWKPSMSIRALEALPVDLGRERAVS